MNIKYYKLKIVVLSVVVCSDVHRKHIWWIMTQRQVLHVQTVTKTLHIYQISQLLEESRLLWGGFYENCY